MEAGTRVKAGAAVLLVGAFAVGGWMLWRHVGPKVMGSVEYRVDPSDIELRPDPPQWIETDIRAEVFQKLRARGPLSLLDEGLVVDVAEAFAEHPWIALVEQVHKRHPSRVTVTVEYRRPVCLVELTVGGRQRLLAVDRLGVLLPGMYDGGGPFAELPVLVGIDTPPMGPAGHPWGDPRVMGGAEVAAAVAHHARAWSLVRIVPTPREPLGAIDRTEYSLLLADGTRIVWGPAPGDAPPGEPTAEQKVERLKRFFAQQPAGGDVVPRDLDVRQLPGE